MSFIRQESANAQKEMMSFLRYLMRWVVPKSSTNHDIENISNMMLRAARRARVRVRVPRARARARAKMRARAAYRMRCARAKEKCMHAKCKKQRACGVRVSYAKCSRCATHAAMQRAKARETIDILPALAKMMMIDNILKTCDNRWYVHRWPRHSYDIYVREERNHRHIAADTRRYYTPSTSAKRKSRRARRSCARTQVRTQSACCAKARCLMRNARARKSARVRARACARAHACMQRSAVQCAGAQRARAVRVVWCARCATKLRKCNAACARAARAVQCGVYESAARESAKVSKARQNARVRVNARARAQMRSAQKYKNALVWYVWEGSKEWRI